jgi:hypothetical protein
MKYYDYGHEDVFIRERLYLGLKFSNQVHVMAWQALQVKFVPIPKAFRMIKVHGLNDCLEPINELNHSKAN